MLNIYHSLFTLFTIGLLSLSLLLQIRKQSWMKDKSRSSNKAHHGSIRAFLKIIKRQLSTAEGSVLNNDLNFVTTIRRVLYLEMIVPVEVVALKIPKDQADELRWKVKQSLEKDQSPVMKHNKGRKCWLLRPYRMTLG